MTPQGPLGPFCQSCGMPMEKPQDFGTAGSGYRVNDYCHYCYRDGAFTDPGVTMGQMIDFCAGVMASQASKRGRSPKASSIKRRSASASGAGSFSNSASA